MTAGLSQCPWVTVSCWRWTHASARAQRTCEVPSLQYPTVRGSYIIVERLFPLFYSSYPCRSVIWLPADPSVSCVFKTTTFSVETIYLLTDSQTTSEILGWKIRPAWFFLGNVCLGMKTLNVLRPEYLRSYVIKRVVESNFFFQIKKIFISYKIIHFFRTSCERNKK